MSRKEREEAEKQFKSIRERKPFEELRQAAKARPVEKPEEHLILKDIDFDALITDERDAGNMYRVAALRLRSLALEHRPVVKAELMNASSEFIKIASDEDRHKMVIEDIRNGLKRLSI